MKDLLLYIARNLVDDPDAVTVTEIPGEQELTLELRVAPDDMENSLDVHGYTSAAGYPGVRKAVADDLNARYDAHIRPENLFFTCGAAPALIAVVRALAVEDAEIVGVAPFFAEYRPFLESNGVKFIVTPPDMEHFQIRLDEMSSLINEHTQAVLINSPNNPSGVVYTKETLEKLAKLLTEKSREVGHTIYLISDEPYRELVYDGAVVSWVPNIYPNTVVCYSYSKSLSLPGERIGYVCVPDSVSESAELYAAVAGAARVLGHVVLGALIELLGKCGNVDTVLAQSGADRGGGSCFTRGDLQFYITGNFLCHFSSTSCLKCGGGHTASFGGTFSVPPTCTGRLSGLSVRELQLVQLQFHGGFPPEHGVGM